MMRKLFSVTRHTIKTFYENRKTKVLLDRAAPKQKFHTISKIAYIAAKYNITQECLRAIIKDLYD